MLFASTEEWVNRSISTVTYLLDKWPSLRLIETVEQNSAYRSIQLCYWLFFIKLVQDYRFLHYKSSDPFTGSSLFKELVMAKLYNRKSGILIEEEVIQVLGVYGCLRYYDADLL